MDDLVSRQAAIEGIEKNACNTQRIFDAVKALPSAQSEHLHTVMEKIEKRYEKAMNTPCINNPMAWALYETWKEYDR